MNLLRIIALEPDDLGIISAHMQDAVLRIADINYSAKARQFSLVANRFEIEQAEKSAPPHRRLTGISFSQVNAVRARRIRQGANEAVLSLLAIEFIAGKSAPDGVIKLTFSGDGNIELDVECVEVQMEDLGPRWSTKNIPAHELPDEPANEQE